MWRIGTGKKFYGKINGKNQLFTVNSSKKISIHD